ncbi:putative metal-binding motif-containing protein [Microbulbifer marinus]|uniref:Putative metal-binding motif-containing protein n=1 Tax=Microbulbifer marinus TaxID=658218 RepID=A0A1H3YYH7_9GAMM|nr:putative metal-binding motif-containing protein [Microbulbifer marinus]SEA16467.1 Putative metal-binding motif-containing protein [Microbulbifer marinus]
MTRLNIILTAILSTVAQIASADVPVQMDVSYSECEIISGGLDLGLSELPQSIDATFTFLSPSFPPPADVLFTPTVLSASLTVGDASVDENDLIEPLALQFNDDIDTGERLISSISYTFDREFLLAACPPNVNCSIHLPNDVAELRVIGYAGADVETGQILFEYYCPRSDESYQEVVCSDADGDGYGSPGNVACSAGPETDCDDTDAAINPGAFELPGNTTDENCDMALTCDPDGDWKNHGQYQRCVTEEVDLLVNTGVLTVEEGDALINDAAQSDTGKDN